MAQSGVNFSHDAIQRAIARAAAHVLLCHDVPFRASDEAVGLRTFGMFKASRVRSHVAWAWLASVRSIAVTAAPSGGRLNTASESRPPHGGSASRKRSRSIVNGPPPRRP